LKRCRSASAAYCDAIPSNKLLQWTGPRRVCSVSDGFLPATQGQHPSWSPTWRMPSSLQWNQVALFVGLFGCGAACEYAMFATRKATSSTCANASPNIPFPLCHWQGSLFSMICSWCPVIASRELEPRSIGGCWSCQGARSHQADPLNRPHQSRGSTPL
jgi:hypothetical protein